MIKIIKEKHIDVGVIIESLKIGQSKRGCRSCKKFKTKRITLNELRQSPNTHVIKTKEDKHSNTNRFSSLFMSAQNASPMNRNVSLQVRVEIFVAFGNEKTWSDNAIRCPKLIQRDKVSSIAALFSITMMAIATNPETELYVRVSE